MKPKLRLIDRIKRWFHKEPQESQTSAAAPQVGDHPMSYKSPEVVYPVPERLRSR